MISCCSVCLLIIPLKVTQEGANSECPRPFSEPKDSCQEACRPDQVLLQANLPVPCQLTLCSAGQGLECRPPPHLLAHQRLIVHQLLLGQLYPHHNLFLLRKSLHILLPFAAAEWASGAPAEGTPLLRELMSLELSALASVAAERLQALAQGQRCTHVVYEEKVPATGWQVARPKQEGLQGAILQWFTSVYRIGCAVSGGCGLSAPAACGAGRRRLLQQDGPQTLQAWGSQSRKAVRPIRRRACKSGCTRQGLPVSHNRLLVKQARACPWSP